MIDKAKYFMMQRLSVTYPGPNKTAPETDPGVCDPPPSAPGTPRAVGMDPDPDPAAAQGEGGYWFYGGQLRSAVKVFKE